MTRDRARRAVSLFGVLFEACGIVLGWLGGGVALWLIITRRLL